MSQRQKTTIAIVGCAVFAVVVITVAVIAIVQERNGAGPTSYSARPAPAKLTVKYKGHYADYWMERLGDADHDIADVAQIALESIGDEATPLLIAAVKDQRCRARFNALRTLGSIHSFTSGREIVVLFQTLARDDPQEGMRQEARRFLAEWGREVKRSPPSGTAAQFGVVLPK